MFEAAGEYPCAVTEGGEEGLELGFLWCANQMEDGDVLTLFIPLRSSLRNSRLLQDWSSYRDVDVVTSRGASFIRSAGPVLAVWPDMDALGQISRSGSRVKALCVAAWVEEWVRPWVTATQAEVLGDVQVWAEVSASDVDPVVEEAMKGLTLTVNHNNTIAAGFEKDQVVGTLLVLHDAGYELDSEELQGWALANGWTGKNPKHLARYVREINSGKRPRTRSMPKSSYLDHLKRKVAGEGSDEE
ncbi:hypothetical protein [Allokutzneria sp. NRRL B-24872]|uniref:hypothetical protein n=1 Tax=Allokutzneria sp. NRRL B-24872 TaxID=1137961 RepID=UPI00117797DA|nr:hypothetical protein [Allokutzneria sp. NRRL B-24872]